MDGSVLLLVDDRPDNLFTLRTLIEEHLPECEVLTAGGAQEGLALAAREPVDGILLDMQMPRMNGLEMCALLKADEATSNIPVILITAHQTTPELRAAGLDAGADDFLSKPVDNVELVAKIRVMLRIKRAEDELRAANAHLDALVSARTKKLEQERNRARRYLETVRESEEKYRELFETVHDAVMLIDWESERIVDVNQAACVLYGYGKGEFLSLNYGEIPAAPEPLDAAVKRISPRRSGTTSPPCHRRKDGTEFPVEISASTFALGNRRMVCIIVRNIAERLAAEERDRRNQKQLALADRMRSLGVLVSGVAHEINNPNHFILTHIGPLSAVVKGAIPILDEYYEAEGDFRLGRMNYSTVRDRIPGMLANIAAGSKRIKTIVDELRGFAREGPSRESGPVCINDVGKSALTLLGNMVEKTTRRFTVTWGKGMPAVHGSFQRLEQVIVNLIQNACQALESPEEEVYLCTEYDNRGKRVVIRVTDTGKGIPEDVLEHVTDPFFTTRQTEGGSGLGLSIASRIVLDHGGELTFAAHHPKGTVATVTLPAL